MRGFQANNCRLCQKVFCCKKCRIKHEKNVHKVFPDCDICVYGIFVLENLGENFLHHLESSHLPVHCVYCKKKFGSIEELLQHKKCNFFLAKELSPKTPFKDPPAVLITTDDRDSPIFLQRQEHLNYILATSTPMQRSEETNLIFDKGEQVITPVDKPIRVTNKSIIKKTDSAKSDEQLSKRRVTFGETPSTNPLEKNMRGNITEDQEIVSGKALESLDSPSLNQKSNENFTPVTGMSTGQFCSATTENGQFYSAKTDVSSKIERDNAYIKNLGEGFTPVGIPNMSKLINVKTDIYKQQDQQKNGSLERRHFDAKDNFKNQDNLSEVSMELCTPAKNLHPLENDLDVKDGDNKDSRQDDISPMTENDNCTHENNKPKNRLDLRTPAKTSNSGKIVVKGNIYKDSEQVNISPVVEVEVTKENEVVSENDQYKSDENSESNQVTNAEITGNDTLWLSATNLEEASDLEPPTDENKEPDETDQATTQEENNPLDIPASPPRNNTRRVSIVMPTPILKTTNVQMKFHFPAHLSSTPIMSSGAVKLKQTKIVKDISTRVIQQQTPFKTPQGKLCEMVQRKLVDANLRRNLVPLSDIESVPSTSGRDTVPFENIKEDYSSSATTVLLRDVVRKPINQRYEDMYSSISSHEPETGISVSSMTESTLWSSMTRIVKSVLGGFTNVSQDSCNMSTNNISNAFKRQLSDSDTGDFLEAPRLKRFKFTDIKCRRTIRDLPALELPRSLPAPAAPLASIEIVRSVSTLYGHQTMRIQCDKATQTDNYLMYGWHPYI